MRLDKVLLARGISPTRSRGAKWVREGLVSVDGKVADDPSQKITEEADVSVNLDGPQWVSRGALKLVRGIDLWEIDADRKVCLDLGASTGGFTEVLLDRGARQVFAVDVGTDQLARKLVQDMRVINLEKLNARDVSEKHIPDQVDILVSDLSFISLKVALPAGLKRLKLGGIVVVLIKPQFEVGKGNLGKNGVVKEPEQHAKVCNDIRSWFGERGFKVNDVCESPITGPKGNKEFLMYATKTGEVTPSTYKKPA